VQLDNGLTVDGALRAGASRPSSAAAPAPVPTPVAPKPAPAGTDNPNSSVATYQARAAISRGDAAEASKLLEQANQLSRNDQQVLCLLAGLYDATGDQARASSFADKCKEAGGSPERVSLPVSQPGALPAQAPAAEPAAPAMPEEPAQPTTIRRRVRTATGDGP
jgi:thioredoxin-like negative regulator of GroEL